MKRKIQFIFTLLSIFYTTSLFSQANVDNYISINVTSSSFTAITTAAQVTTQQTKTSAFILTMEARNTNARIFVQGSTTSPIPISKLAVKLNALAGSGSSSVTGQSFTAMYLTGATQQLFSITKTNNANKAITATYDLVLDAIGWSVQGGSSYSFSLTFTMTQP
jgi:hypothetical protein